MGDVDAEVVDSLKRQGSLRKVLPPNPSSESPLSLSAKMIDRPAMSSRNVNKAYNPYLQEYSIISEYGMVREQSIPGVYVIPSAQSSLCKYCISSNPFLNQSKSDLYHQEIQFYYEYNKQGVYQGGVFRFTLCVPENFPECKSPPRITFQSAMFHPEVDIKSGEMNIKRGFPEWRKGVNHVWEVLEYMRKAFYKIDITEPLNLAAAEMFKNKPELFLENAKLCVANSKDHLYDPPPVDDPHYLRFDPYDSSTHEQVRQAVLNPKAEDDSPSSLGFSWIQPGSLEPFSKSN